MVRDSRTSLPSSKYDGLQPALARIASVRRPRAAVTRYAADAPSEPKRQKRDPYSIVSCPSVYHRHFIKKLQNFINEMYGVGILYEPLLSEAVLINLTRILHHLKNCRGSGVRHISSSMRKQYDCLALTTLEIQRAFNASALSAVHATADERRGDEKGVRLSLPRRPKTSETAPTLPDTVLTPSPHFSSHEKAADQNFKASHEKFHFKKKLRVKAASGYAVSPREYTKWIAVCSSIRTDDTALHQPRSDAKKARKSRAFLKVVVP
ncbi:hypothetical protein EVAR_40740_1 [Eumeta japonica]|uniref:Uncharacterized protein n=1 Tax=Eumeta variegata TaxID=151549 RepID=A0A4C1X3B7_EUMVA|nr:hypothetical protein EVAR_40740_1 [Eumeta japonica]